MTDARLIASYLEDMHWRRLSQTTIDIRATYLAHLSRELGPFDKVKAKNLRAWLADVERDLAPSTQAVYLNCYHGFYTWAIKNKRLKKDPTLKLDKPKAKKGEPHPILAADLATALANADPRMRCWLALGAFAGCRCKEITGVRREDIYDDPTMRLYIAETKGDKPRWVSLNPLLLDALDAGGMLLASGRLWPDMTPQKMSKAIAGYLHAMDARRVDGKLASAHALRHWFGTELFQSTLDILLVKDAMGHESVATTQGYAASDTSKAAGSVAALGSGLYLARSEIEVGR